MTPCQELGYKVGDLFEIAGSEWFPSNAIIQLIRDDGSNQPLFEQVSGIKRDDGVWWECLFKVRPYILIEENE